MQGREQGRDAGLPLCILWLCLFTVSSVYHFVLNTKTECKIKFIAF